jgi:hypothetical protein
MNRPTKIFGRPIQRDYTLLFEILLIAAVTPIVAYGVFSEQSRSHNAVAARQTTAIVATRRLFLPSAGVDEPSIAWDDVNAPASSHLQAFDCKTRSA